MNGLVHVARHGQTVWHRDNRYAGSSDVALTDRGRTQARSLGRWAADEGVLSVWSSPLGRAIETADLAAAAAGARRGVEPDLRESDFGLGEGLTRTEMAERIPDELAAFLAAPASSPLPGGEPGSAAAARFVAVLRRVAEEPVPPLVVAHTTVLRLSLCSLLGIPLDEYRSRFPELGNCTVTTLRLDNAGRAALLRFNVPV